MNHLAVLFSLLAVLDLKLNVRAAARGKPLSKDCLDDGTGSPLRPVAYQTSCPEVEAIVFARVEEAVLEEPRMAASLLRLHFHDCFVNVSQPL